jgi:hypothetical protein
MRATDRLIIGLGALAGLAYDPVEIVRLKNAYGELIDYRDAPATRRMRREIRQLNEAFATVIINLEAPDVEWQGDVVPSTARTSCPRRSGAIASSTGNGGSAGACTARSG